MALGTALFERDGRAIRLSADGEQLMRHVGNAFEELRRGVEAVTTAGHSCCGCIARRASRHNGCRRALPGFLAAYPEISVRLAASTDYAPFSTDEFDADIVYGPAAAMG